MAIIEEISALLQEIVQTEVLPWFGTLSNAEIFAKPSRHDPHDVVSIVDRAVEARLAREISRIQPDAAVLGEEAAAEAPELLTGLSEIPKLWIIDPIDGTKAFVKGKPGYGVMLAYVERGETIRSWIVLPAKNDIFVAERGSGATLNGEQLKLHNAIGATETLHGSLHTRFMPHDTREALESSLRGKIEEIRTSGCAAIEYTQLAQGRKDFGIYYRLMPWDHAPGALLLHEAGGATRTVAGVPYRVGTPDGLLIAARSTEIAHSLGSLISTGV